jgi:hypothetical protein
MKILRALRLGFKIAERNNKKNVMKIILRKALLAYLTCKVITQTKEKLDRMWMT